MGSTAIPGGSSISSRGETSSFAMAVKECFTFAKAGNDLNSAISLTEIFDRILFMFVTVCVLGYKKQKTGSGNSRVYRKLNRNNR